VKVLPTQKTALEAAQESEDRRQRKANDRATIQFNKWLVGIGVLQLVVFVLQLSVFGYQALKLRQTVDAAAQQSRDMRESITEATRSANAMEKSAEAVTKTSQAASQSVVRIGQQMRAYLSSRINGGIFQDRAANLRFGVTPMVINTGLTPAHKVGYSAKAAVLPFPLEAGHVFPPLDPPRSVFGLLAPQQNFIMDAFVDGDYFDDVEAENIKRGNGKRVYIWGTITYEDVFGDKRYTNFCQSICWILGKEGDVVWGNYSDRHNEAV
jgi:hypothetical protein